MGKSLTRNPTATVGGARKWPRVGGLIFQNHMLKIQNTFKYNAAYKTFVSFKSASPTGRPIIVADMMQRLEWKPISSIVITVAD